MTRLTLACAITMALATVSATGAGSPPAQDTKERQKFDPTRDAALDIEHAIQEATKDGRHIILDVGGEWCSWCHKLDKFFDDNAEIAQFMNEHYVVVKVNYSKENKNEQVLSRYPAIKGYPHLFVLDADGTLIHSQDTGQLEAGKGYDRDKVFDFLKAWAPAKGS